MFASLPAVSCWNTRTFTVNLLTDCCSQCEPIGHVDVVREARRGVHVGTMYQQRAGKSTISENKITVFACKGKGRGCHISSIHITIAMR